jgi:hypothetical protein
MACKSIGPANPEIAGTGVHQLIVPLLSHRPTHISQILVAFVIQSLIAVIVSGYTWILSYAIQIRWDAAAEPGHQASRKEDEVTQRIRTFSVKGKTWLEQFSLIRKCKEASLRFGLYPAQEQNDEIDARLLAKFAWLIGKQPEDARQRSSDSKIEDEITPTTMRLECANRILLAGSDSQIFTGIEHWVLFDIG